MRRGHRSEAMVVKGAECYIEDSGVEWGREFWRKMVEEQRFVREIVSSPGSWYCCLLMGGRRKGGGKGQRGRKWS